MRTVAVVVDEPLLEAAQAVQTEARRLLSKGGRQRAKGPRGGRVHIPSPPGQPPHLQTGALRASVQYAELLTVTKQRAYVVGPTEKYGKYHEFGTSRHQKRPFMRPAIFNVMRTLRRVFGERVKEGIARSGLPMIAKARHGRGGHE
jgi:HK97 gp10 family phage protein